MKDQIERAVVLSIGMRSPKYAQEEDLGDNWRVGGEL